MRLPIGLGIGGLLALVAGLVLPHLPDSAIGYGTSTFQGAAAYCFPQHPAMLALFPPPGRSASQFLASCATAHDVMNLGAWLVVLGALALVVAVVVLILGRIRRRPAVGAYAV